MREGKKGKEKSTSQSGVSGTVVSGQWPGDRGQWCNGQVLVAQ